MSKRNNDRIKNSIRRGFTMVELLAILIILGLLAAKVVVTVADKVDKARVITTKSNLKLLSSAVNQFKMDTGNFPTEEDGLYVLVEDTGDIPNYAVGGYLETTDIPQDAWGYDFIFELWPDSGKPFVIISYGADGQEGGEDYDADLYSTDAN